MIKKAKRLSRSKKKKKRKKEERSSSSSSGTESSSLTSGSETDAMGLFCEETRLKRLWRQYPGVLTAQALSEMKNSLMTGSGTLWSIEKTALPPLCTHYARTQLMHNMAIVAQQEALTLYMHCYGSVDPRQG